MERKRITFIKIFASLVSIVCAFLLLKSTPASAAEDYLQVANLFEPGTNCRKPANPLESVVCGVVRVATPLSVNINEQSAINPNPPSKGVSVYVYECNPLSPSCKTNGALVNPYSSTSTDENGYYYITMRKIGNLQIRYLVFTCGGRLAGLFKVPSYKSFTLNTPVNCPAENSYTVAPATLNPVSSAKLSCDIIKPNPIMPVTSVEGQYTNSYKPVTEYNFWLEIAAADSRYEVKKDANIIGLWDTLLNDDDVVADKGAFYSKDCQMIYNDNSTINRLCYGNLFKEIGAYETALYSDNRLTTMNFLPNIPIRNSLLFYKDLTARQDVVNYSQNPTAPAQLLQTIFSNCKGKTFLRKYKGTATDTLPDCELLKDCNYAAQSGTPEQAAGNRQYTGGPTKGLANPAILAREGKAIIGLEEVSSTQVCTKDGSKITISEIQPPWSYCELGTAGCDYKLDKTYWSYEFVYFFGNKGLSTKVGYSFEGSNDTFYGASPNQVAWKEAVEKGGDPVKGGTYYSDNNYGLYRNNGMTSLLGGIIGNEMASTGDELSYVLRRPGENDSTVKAIYEQGAVKIEDAGSNLLSFCENSNVNDHTQGVEFTKANEGSLFLNNNFKGNPDHYFALLDLFGAGKRSGTSTVYLTTAANNRNIQLGNAASAKTPINGISRWQAYEFDAYDSALTASHGDGKYSLSDFFLTVLGLFANSTYEKSKSFFDRESTYPMAVGADGGSGDLRDDLKVSFGLSEEGFEGIFGLPGGGHVVDTDWGTSGCYPWNDIGVNGYCYEKFEVGYGEIPTEVTRTCKVQTCSVYEISTGCNWCVYEGGALKFDCYKDSGLTGSCTAGDTYDLGAIGPDVHFSQACAKVKIDCMSGPGSASQDCIEDHYGLEDIPEATCPASGYWNVNWSGNYERYPEWDQYDYEMGMLEISCEEGYCYAPSWGDAFRCKDQYGDFHDEFERSCTVGVTKQSSKAPACNMQDAGPFICTGSIDKDSTFRTTQQILRGDSATVTLDNTKTINNEYWKKFANPNAVSKTYSTLAFQSTDTSVTGSVANKPPNTNKDIPGFGGASPEYKQISAHPLYANIYEGGKPIDNVCSGETCNLLPVPTPEIVDPDDLDVGGSCSMNVDGNCLNALGAGSGYDLNLSPTFTTILNAAGKRFGVDAALLLAYLSGIHKFENGIYVYLFSKGGEQSLIEASYPWYGSVASCDVTNSGAIGAFDWIGTWFKKAIDGGAGAGLNELSSGRSATASRCNFLDSAYAAAYNLSTLAGSTCDADWSSVENSVLSMMFGTERTGAYSDAAISGTIAKIRSVYEACKN